MILLSNLLSKPKLNGKLYEGLYFIFAILVVLEKIT